VVVLVVHTKNFFANALFLVRSAAVANNTLLAVSFAEDAGFRMHVEDVTVVFVDRTIAIPTIQNANLTFVHDCVEFNEVAQHVNVQVIVHPRTLVVGPADFAVDVVPLLADARVDEAFDRRQVVAKRLTFAGSVPTNLHHGFFSARELVVEDGILLAVAVLSELEPALTRILRENLVHVLSHGVLLQLNYYNV
jgi:hypothetical protein